MARKKLEKLLYVEDDHDIQAIAKLALVDVGGFTINICGTGKEAIEVAPSFQPDLILLDVMMPGMDGVATFKELKKLPQFEKTPIIFLTAKVQAPEVREYKKLGAVDVIFKPFDPMTISEKIRRIWHSLDE